MARVPDAAKVDLARDVASAWKYVDTGVVAATTKKREKYWHHWSRYCKRVHADPFLHPATTPGIVRDTLLAAFAARVRTGCYGRGNRIRVQGSTDALAAISKTIELAGESSPVYRAPNRYHSMIEQMLEGMRRDDPPSVPQLAVPVAVPEKVAIDAYTTSCPKQQAIGDLAIIAFYYLLRVGEYTHPRYVTHRNKRIRATRTVQFTVANIGFHKNGKHVSKRSSLEHLLTCDEGTMKITNQKNGRRGQTITHETIADLTWSPVKALARRVHHIVSNGGFADGEEPALLCTVYMPDGSIEYIQPQDMMHALRTAVVNLKLHQNGIDPDLIGVHSLRAGGATALHLAGVADTTIQKQGRWTSTTFLQYIHNQLAVFSRGLSAKMSTKLTFTNVSNISA